MNPPYESANTVTVMRLVEAILRKGHHVNVMAYEGAVAYTAGLQKPHPNPVKGRSVDEEKHPNTKDWVTALFQFAHSKGLKLDWIRCGLCEDERGVHENPLPGTRRGSPVDFFHDQIMASDNVLIIPCR